MTREGYLEMCDQLGAEPVESEMPVDLGDLPIEAIQAWSVYSILPHKYDSMSGTYQGKSLEHFSSVMSILQIQEDHLDIFKIVTLIDAIESEAINSKIKQSRKSSGK